MTLSLNHIVGVLNYRYPILFVKLYSVEQVFNLFFTHLALLHVDFLQLKSLKKTVTLPVEYLETFNYLVKKSLFIQSPTSLVIYWEIKIRNSLKSILPLLSSSTKVVKTSSYCWEGLWPSDLRTVLSSWIVGKITLLLMHPSPSLSKRAKAYRNYSICSSVIFSKNI